MTTVDRHPVTSALPDVSSRRADRPLAVAVLLSRTAVAVVTATALALHLFGLGWGDAAPAVAATGLLLGVPHGAVDHLALQMRGGSHSRQRLMMLAGVYLGLAVVTWLLLRWMPAAGLAAFLLVSVAHFGIGEATFHRLRGVQVSRLVAPGAGSATVLLPLVAHPAAVAPYLAMLVPGWDGRLPVALTAAAVVVALALAVAAALAATKRGQRGVAFELALLTLLAIAAPPVVSIAVYFGAWHAVRHSAVLVADETTASVSAPAAAVRLARSAVLPTLAALTVLALLWWVAAGGELDEFIGQQVWVLAALTVPHAAVVWWLDRTRPASDRPTTCLSSRARSRTHGARPAPLRQRAAPGSQLATQGRPTGRGSADRRCRGRSTRPSG